jgi:hypothetical protein
MKKLLLLLTFTGFISQAQTAYNKMIGVNNSEWYEFFVPIPISPAPGNGQSNFNTGKNSGISSIFPDYGKWSATKDTFVMGKNYKKFYHVYNMPSFPMNTHVGYIREDSAARKVYFLDKTASAEDLLYDFSLNVGDSVFYNFPTMGYTFYKGYYKVKSIQNVSTVLGTRKQFKLRDVGNSGDTLVYTEGIGCNIHPLYLYTSGYPMGGWFTSMSAGCKYPYIIGLACKYSDGIKQFQSCTYTVAQTIGCIFKYDSCNYWNTCSSIRENSMIENFNLYPNPAKSKTTINFFLNEDVAVSIEVVDVMGRKVKTIRNEKMISGENNIDFSVDDIAPGSYFINVRVKERDSKVPFVIVH